MAVMLWFRDWNFYSDVIMLPKCCRKSFELFTWVGPAQVVFAMDKYTRSKKIVPLHRQI